MTQDVETAIQTQASIALRLSEPNIVADVWPCTEDKLDRYKEIENLTPVLLNAQAPLVFALEAPWGGGKTTFIKLWQQYLTSQGQVSLTLNAWESDFCDDPLLPMLSTLDSWLSQQSEEGAAGKAWKKTKGLVPSMLKASAVAAVKVATLGALDADKAIEGAVAAATGEITGNIVDTFNGKVKALKNFKALLATALEALPADQPNLIIFVDELDRCRPSYAIEVLERIKHLFDIERVVFVLAINREQLGNSMQGVYGPAFNGDHYLKRFIDLDYHLQVPELDAFIAAQLNQPDLITYASHRDIEKDFVWVRKTFCWLCRRFNYQLRDVNQLITRFRLIIRSIPVDQYLNPQVLCAMMFLREHNLELYRAYRANITHTNDVILFLLGGAKNDSDYPDAFRVVSGVLLGAVDESNDEAGLIKYWEEKRDSLDERNPLKNMLNRMLLIARQQNNWSAIDSADLAYKRIELMEKITITTG